MIEIALDGGLTVQFPFEPYACQEKLMNKIAYALRQRGHALLESPTGTGKTLCLLCTTLSWQQAYKTAVQLVNRNSVTEVRENTNALKVLEIVSNNALANEDFVNSPKPKIFYASRTHSQLSQVIKELENTQFGGGSAKICVLGSRDQMCTNDSVAGLPGGNAAQSAACRKLVSFKACQYHVNFSKRPASTSSMPNMDIEELVKYSRRSDTCAYYVSREMYKNADIVFLPYNYLVDPVSRKSQNIDVSNSVIIFDEAHNVESSCNEAASFELSISDLDSALADLDKCEEFVDWPDFRGSFTRNDLEYLSAIIRGLSKEINSVHLEKNQYSKKQAVLPGTDIINMLSRAGAQPKQSEEILNILKELIHGLSDISQRRTSMGKSSTGRKSSGLSHFESCLKSVFTPQNIESPDTLEQSYRVFVQEQTVKDPRTYVETTSRVLSLWCFNSGVVMNSLLREGCRSIILASGTLSPLESFSSELQIPFAATLENPHVISQSQIFVSILKTGPQGIHLNSSYAHRNDSRYHKDTGNTLVNFAKCVPDGVLVFFPSYYLMDFAMNVWKKKDESARESIWERLGKIKSLHVEPKQKTDFARTMSEFYASASTSRGSIFFAVCRGKASEGIDFSDTRCRAVFVTGIPLPSIADPRVTLKRKFLDDLKSKHGSSLGNGKGATGNGSVELGAMTYISGHTWYEQQGARAVNQAIGRVIRHRNDWGAIVLCDERFAEERNIAKLPAWIREYVTVYPEFGTCFRDAHAFFRERGIEESKAKVLRQSVDNSSSIANVNQLQKKSTISSSTTTSSVSLFVKRKAEDALIPSSGEAKYVIENQQVPESASAATSVVGVSIKTLSKKSDSVAEKRLKKSNSGAPPQDKAVLEHRAKQFLETIKTSLPKPEYKKFQSLLKEFRSSSSSASTSITPFNTLMAGLESVFGTNEHYILLRDVEFFLPSSQKAQFMKRIEEFETRFRPLDKTIMTHDGVISQQQLQQQHAPKRTGKVPCVVCEKGTLDRPFKSGECEHIACFTCWTRTKHCPECGASIRIRKLEKVYFK